MGQSKISLKELTSVRRNALESIDDYLNRFRFLKARCFTQVPEHELVEMAAGGLDYSIRKKLNTQQLIYIYIYIYRMLTSAPEYWLSSQNK